MRIPLLTQPAARRVRAVWAPSLVRRVLRSRWFAFGAVIVVTAASIANLHSRVAAAEAERVAWGSSRWVAVVSDPVRAGQPLDGAVRWVERPDAMVPEGAVTELPVGARAAVDVVVGEILLRSRLVGGPTSLRPAGTLAVTVAIDGAAALVEPGDLVDLWSTDVATLTSVQVVAAVVVLDRTEDALTVAVPEPAMADVAVAALRPLTVAQR